MSKQLEKYCRADVVALFVNFWSKLPDENYFKYQVVEFVLTFLHDFKIPSGSFLWISLGDCQLLSPICHFVLFLWESQLFPMESQST